MFFLWIKTEVIGVLVTIIKFIIVFEPIYYIVNLSGVSSSMVFSDLVFLFLSMYCLFKSINLFYF